MGYIYILTPKDDHFSTRSAKKTLKVYNTWKVTTKQKYN